MPNITAQGIALSHPCIWDAKALAKTLCALRSSQEKLHVVFTNGCYDILHPGHVHLLAEAKALGDVLVVGLNSDTSIRTLGKGTDRPLQPLEVRAFMAAHLESVDYVTAFDQSTPLELITLLRPDILVKGGDWSVENIVGAEVVRSYGGQVYSLPLLQGYSTTQLAQHIRRTCP